MDDLKVLQLALKMYMFESKFLRLRVLAMLLLATITVAAGIEPTWTRVALAALFLVAFLATLRFTQVAEFKEE